MAWSFLNTTLYKLDSHFLQSYEYAYASSVLTNDIEKEVVLGKSYLIHFIIFSSWLVESNKVWQ